MERSLLPTKEQDVGELEEVSESAGRASIKVDRERSFHTPHSGLFCKIYSQNLISPEPVDQNIYSLNEVKTH